MPSRRAPPIRPATVLLLWALALAGTAAERPRVVAYLPTWSGLARQAASIPYARLSHLDLAFINPGDDDGSLAAMPGADAVIAQAHQHGVQVLVSLGGGAASEDPAQRARLLALIAKDRRAGFIRTLAAYLRTHRLDGLDVDLEGPAITDDHAGFIGELAAALHADGRQLTAALSSGYGGERVTAAALACFDAVHLMAYDRTGPWTPDQPGPHSSLAHAQAEVAFWSARGLPRERMVLGVPGYGYSFNADRTVTALSFAAILARHPEAASHDQVGSIFYNGHPALRAKAALVTSAGLGGMMLWSLDQDAPGAESLLGVIAQELGR